MFDLRKLWANRLRVLAENLAAGEQEHREIANLALHIGADYQGRFLIELLQNAGDQASRAGITDSTVTIIRSKELFAVTDQGIAFRRKRDSRDHVARCQPQRPRRLALGNKGVGLEAVFQITAAPEVYGAVSSEKSFADADGNRFALDGASS